MRVLVLAVVVALVGCGGAVTDEAPAQVLARLDLPTKVLDQEERDWLEDGLRKSDAGKSLFDHGPGRHTAWVREMQADGEWAPAGSGGITSYPHVANIEWVISMAYDRCESRKQAGSTCYVLWLDGWIID